MQTYRPTLTSCYAACTALRAGAQCGQGYSVRTVLGKAVGACLASGSDVKMLQRIVRTTINAPSVPTCGGVHAFKRVLAPTSQDPLTRKRQICHKRCQRASSKDSESSVGVSIMLRCYTAQPGFDCLFIYFCFLSSYASHRRLASVPARTHRALSGLVRARLRLSGDSPPISPCTRGGQGPVRTIV